MSFATGVANSLLVSTAMGMPSEWVTRGDILTSAK